MLDHLPMPVLIRMDVHVECRMTLVVEQSLDEVWRALTEPADLAQWLAPGTIEPHLGGAVKIALESSGTTIDSFVTAWAPLRRLGYSWSDGQGPLRPVNWRLTTVPRGVAIELTVGVPIDEDAARAFAGWSAHLHMLGAFLAGVPLGFPLQQFREFRDAFGAQLRAA